MKLEIRITFMPNIKNWITKHIKNVLFSFLLFATILFITFSTSQPYQTDIDFYFFVAMICFSVLCICLVDLKRKSRCFIMMFVGEIAVLCYFKAKGITAETYGPVYSKVLMLHATLFVINAATILELLVSGVLRERLKKKNVLWWLLVASAIIALIADKHMVVPLIIPMVVFLLCDIDREQWSKLTDCFCVAYCCCFVVLFTKSILTNQDNLFGRYYGDFLNVGAGGMFAGGAAVCALFMLYKSVRKISKNKLEIVGASVFLLYTLYALVKFQSRGAVCGAAFALLGLWIFGFSKSYKSILTKFLICVGSIVILVALVIGLSVLINKLNPNISGSDPYWEYRIAQLTNGKSHLDSFEDNCLLNTIDTFSSGRLSIVIQAIKQIRPWPVDFGSPHNFFLSWLLDYGVIGGVLFIVWYVVFLIKGIQVWKDDKERALLPLLWHVCCFGAFMFLTNHWHMILPFVLLVLQYPMAVKHKEH